MQQAQPRDLSRKQVAQLLSQTNHYTSIGNRIEALSRHFLGHPYEQNPLIGSADTAEVFTANLDGFDCVTYIESVLALAHASQIDDFIASLRKIRYERGRIQWLRRNHYVTFWIRNNIHERIIRPVSTQDLSVIRRERVLNVVPGLAARRILMKCVPKASMPRLQRRLKTGDLIFFASTRRNLDVFHAGIIAVEDKKTLLRHASRSQGVVVEQELSAFVKANRMAGVIVVRPCETRGRAA